MARSVLPFSVASLFVMLIYRKGGAIRDFIQYFPIRFAIANELNVRWFFVRFVDYRRQVFRRLRVNVLSLKGSIISSYFYAIDCIFMIYRPLYSRAFAPERIVRFVVYFHVVFFGPNIARRFKFTSVYRSMVFRRCEWWFPAVSFSGFPVRRVSGVFFYARNFRNLSIPYRVRRWFGLVFDQFSITRVRCPRFTGTFIMDRLRLLVGRDQVRDSRPWVVIQSSPVQCVVVGAISSAAYLFLEDERISSVSMVIVAPRRNSIFKGVRANVMSVRCFFMKGGRL